MKKLIIVLKKLENLFYLFFKKTIGKNKNRNKTNLCSTLKINNFYIM